MMKKDQHMLYALDCKYIDSLSDIKLKYLSLPNLNIEDIDISTIFCNMKFSTPIYINAMTGGSSKASDINKRLEYICSKLDIFMFSGSYSPALNNSSYYYPKNCGVNIGADKSLENMKKAITDTNAKILQIHLNPLQELLMENGDINFISWTKNIKDAIENISIPIIIKETGFGMGEDTFEKLASLGVKTIDISSKGGTNFAYIEDKRRNLDRQYLYEIGYTLKQSLQYAKRYMDSVEILASGGINNPMQVVKCLAMGAKAIGISGYILRLLIDYTDEQIIQILKEWIYEIKLIMLLTGSKNIYELHNKWEEKI